MDSSPFALTQFGPADLKGIGTYAYTITGNNGQPAWAIYVIDGGAYRGFGPGGDLFKGYDFIKWQVHAFRLPRWTGTIRHHMPWRQ